MSRLLILIPNLGPGGAQKIFRDQLQFYSTHIDTVGCVFNWDGAFEEDRLIKNIFSLRVAGGKNSFTKIYYFFLRVFRLGILKRRLGITHCISHLEGADYVNVLSHGSDKRTCWIHGTKRFDHNIEGFVGWLRKGILIPFFYQRSDQVVVVSEGIRKELTFYFGVSSSRITKIVNGFDLEEIKKLSNESCEIDLKLLAKSNHIVITHCRLARQKNISSLLSIFSKLKITSRPVLVILGDGEQRDQLIMNAKSIGLKTYSVWESNSADEFYDVFFLGHQSNPYPLLRQARLYVMTSLWEGFPLSLCEAMACGVPVIAADCFTGPREILSSDIGLSQPVEEPYQTPYGQLMPLANSPEANDVWTHAIAKLLQDEPTMNSLATAGSKRILEFDKRVIQTKWLIVINE